MNINTNIESGGSRASKSTFPYFSIFVIIACTGIFLGPIIGKNYLSLFAEYCYVPPNIIWDGAYWGLFTSVFVHANLWHLLFNLYWLWILGSCLETTIGTVRFVLFFLAAAFVSSTFQIAVSDNGGIGASGVGYALFGFMWFARKRYPHFTIILNMQTIQLFLIWLVICLVTTHLNLLHIGNAAHISGLIFGVLVARAFTFQRKKSLWGVALAIFIVLSIIPLFWCPWSVTWLGVKAYNAHVSHKYEDALVLYSRLINVYPDNSWAYYNRSLVYRALGDITKAEEDLNRAHALDPSIEAPRERGIID